MILSLALLAMPQTLDVGPGGFATIQAAIDAASPGDVIAVAAGTYSGFTMTKPLTVSATVNAPGSTRLVRGSTLVSGVPAFSLVGLDFENLPGDNSTVLRIENVSGRGHVDDCRVTSTEPAPGTVFLTPNALVISACSDVVVSRSTMRGRFPAGLGIRGGSFVAVVDSTVIGDDGVPAAANGTHIVSSNVLFAGGRVVGGDSEDFTVCATTSGHAIGAISSTLTIAGTELDPGTALDACGLTLDGCHIGDVFDFPLGSNTVYATGPCLTGTGGPTVSCRECDVNYDVTASGLDAPIPRLVATGSDVPFMQRTLELYGPPAEIGVIALSLAPTFATLPGQGQWLWVDLGAPLFKLFFVAGQTFTTPATKSLTIPAPDPDLDGVVVHAQALFPLLPGIGTAAGTLVTNPTNIILRP